MRRPTLDEYFLDMAQAAAGRSTCPRLKVGAVVARGRFAIATGYNGAPVGMPHCDEVGCLLSGDHCVNVVHAEANAITLAGGEGDTLYSTHAPCLDCLKLAMNSGITRIVYAQWYGDQDRDEFLQRAADHGAKMVTRMECYGGPTAMMKEEQG